MNGRRRIVEDREGTGNALGLENERNDDQLQDDICRRELPLLW